MSTSNTAINEPVKWAWPIIVFFFSVIGIVLYLTTSRPPGIGRKQRRRKDAGVRDLIRGPARILGTTMVALPAAGRQLSSAGPAAPR